MEDRNRQKARLRKLYPVIADLEEKARRRLPRFIFDFLQGATGEELGRRRNRSAWQAIEIVPRYGIDIGAADTATKLFGRDYAAPIVIAPVGMDGAIWPGASRHLAEAAAQAGIPYMASSMAADRLEAGAVRAAGNFWFQLYSFPANDHGVTLDLLRRADVAGAHVLAVTVDIPTPARRVRDMRHGMKIPFGMTPALLAQALLAPVWSAATLRHGLPTFANFSDYSGADTSRAAIDRFVSGGRAGSGIDWQMLARVRDLWKRPLVVKGLLHPADAEKALSLGFDGIVVSNHGGRQFDPAPASVDVLPAVRAAVGSRMQLLVDGGIMSGSDVLKALACGADAVMAGRAFMLGLAAIGPAGASHVAETLMEELLIALRQTGAVTPEGVRTIAYRHPGAWPPEHFKSTDPGKETSQ